MPRVKARHLVQRARKGRVVHYWQPTARLKAVGHQIVRLSDDPAEAFREAERLNAELDAWRAGTLVADTPASPLTNSLAMLDDLFQRSDEFRKGMGDRSRRDYHYNIKAGLDMFGPFEVRAISRGTILEWHMQARDQRGASAARNSVAALRRLLSFGAKMDWITTNPALELRLAEPQRTDRVWTEEERDTFVATAREQGWPSMALAVMLGWCLGQRPADLRTLTWKAYDGRSIAIQQAKTKARIRVPVLPELAELLDATERRAPQIVVSDGSGTPFGESDFQHRFAAIRRKAGLPADLQFRLLRHTLATALGRAGCTDDQIRAVTGHQTRAVVARYVQPDDTYARAAIARLADYRKQGRGAG